MLAPNTTINNEWGKSSFFSILYSISLSKTVVHWKRIDLITDIGNFGGIMGLITVVFTAILAPIVNFQQDLDLTKVMYT